MNTQQIEDLKLLYEAVYDEDLRIQSEDYNNIVFDEDIVEIATEYFYNYGLNENGVGILIEKVGLDNFVEFVYNLSDDLIILSEARNAKRRPRGGKSYDQIMREIEERESKKRAKKEAKDKASKAAEERKESERKDPESKGPDTEAKKEQSKSRPIRDAIARRILAGMERHRKATQTADKMAKETGETLSKLASVTREAGRRAGEHVKTYGLKSLANEEFDGDLFDYILEHLVAEGYADTNENALVIMANMSEEWKQSIVEAEVLAMKKGVPGSVKVRPALSIPGTDIGIGPNRPVPGTFTTTTPEQRAKIKSGDTHIDRGIYMQPRQGAGPTSNERRRYNKELIRQNKYNVPGMSEEWRQSIVEAPGEWFGGLRDRARASRASQMQSAKPTPKPGPTVSSPFAKPASRNDSGKLTTYGAGGGAAAERRGQTRAQVMRQGAKNLENKNRNPGPNFGR